MRSDVRSMRMHHPKRVFARKKSRILDVFPKKSRVHLDFSPKINVSRISKIRSLRKTHD